MSQKCKLGADSLATAYRSTQEHALVTIVQKFEDLRLDLVETVPGRVKSSVLLPLQGLYWHGLHVEKWCMRRKSFWEDQLLK